MGVLGGCAGQRRPGGQIIRPIAVTVRWRATSASRRPDDLQGVGVIGIAAFTNTAKLAGEVHQLFFLNLLLGSSICSAPTLLLDRPGNRALEQVNRGAAPMVGGLVSP